MTKVFVFLSSLAKFRIVRGRAFVCMIDYFGQSDTINLMHAFLVAGWWVAVNLYLQCKILRGEARANGVLIHEEEKNLKTIPIPPPILSD